MACLQSEVTTKSAQVSFHARREARRNSEQELLVSKGWQRWAIVELGALDNLAANEKQNRPGFHKNRWFWSR